MPASPDRARILLDRLSLFLAASGILLRWLTAGETAPGSNLPVDLLVWIALTAQLASKALSGDRSWKFGGPEFGMMALIFAVLLSFLKASCKFAAVDPVLSFMYGAFLFTTVLQTSGPVLWLRLILSAALALEIYAWIQFFFLFPQTRLEFPHLPVEVWRRLESREVMSTFFYPNTFAGYLVFVLPLLTGLLVDSRPGGLRGLIPPAIALGMGGTALAMTGSAGAWSALAVGMVAFMGLAATRRRGRPWVVAAGTAAALLGAVILAAELPRLAHWNLSFRNREAYWTAAMRIFRTSPWLGVGPGNFQDYYPEYKPDIPQETRKAHNDYLEILAETGVLGLASFLTMVVLGLRPALSRGGAVLPPPGREGPPSALPLGAGLAAFLLAPLLGDRLLPGPALACGGAWLAGFLGWRPAAVSFEFTRLGLAAGLVALLSHMAVDFDLGDRGVSSTLFLGLALGILLRGAPTQISFPRGWTAAAAGVLTVLLLWLSLGAAPRWIAAEHAAAEARQALDRFEEEFRRGNLDTASLSRALERSETARRNNPLETEAILLYARSQFRFWDLLRRRKPSGESALRELQEKEQVILLAVEDALRVRPRDLGALGLKVWALRAFRQERRRGGHGGGPAKDRSLTLADGYLEEALEAQRRSLTLYPTWALNSYTMARLLDLRGRFEEADGHYRRALDLHRRAAAEPWGTGRLELPPLPLARTLRRLDRPGESLEILQNHLRRLIEGAPPREARSRIEHGRRSPELLGGAEDEMDDLMRPVIEAAADHILKTLPS